MHSAEYEAYIRSPEWQDRRRQFFLANKQRRFCSGCGGIRRIQVHHVSYVRLGNERDLDLVSVCERCHVAVHAYHHEHGGTLREATFQALKQIQANAPEIKNPQNKGKGQKKKRKRPSDPNLRIFPRKPRPESNFVPQRQRLTLEQRRQGESGVPVRYV